MLRARCTYLTDLSRLLQEKYQLRNEALAHSRSAELIQAECDLIRVNKVITRHRLRCPICKLQDARARAAAAMRPRPIAAEAPLALLDMAS
jgi:hypothetical protein